jgi:hypothetical protein
MELNDNYGDSIFQNKCQETVSTFELKMALVSLGYMIMISKGTYGRRKNRGAGVRKGYVCGQGPRKA